MSTPAVQLCSALLTIAALIGTGGVVVSALAAGRSVVAHQISLAVVEHRSVICASVAGVAMLGSLYFSEVAHYVPCTLCWYQRIAMYSLAVLATTAAIRRETPTAYFVVLAGIGAPISAYHWLLERFPDLDTGACAATTPCTLVWFEKFGFVTLPFMALAAFVTVLAVCLVTAKEPR